MAFLDFLLGKKEKTEQVPRFTPQQQGLQNDVISGTQQGLPQAFQYLQQILGDSPELMEQFQAPAMRQFNEDIIPSIAERFSSMGSQKSNAFGLELGQAGAGLAENLEAQRANLKGGAVNSLQGLLNPSMQSSFENNFRPATSGLLGGALSNASQGLGQAGGMAAMMKLLPMLGIL